MSFHNRARVVRDRVFSTKQHYVNRKAALLSMVLGVHGELIDVQLLVMNHPFFPTVPRDQYFGAVC